MPRSRRTRRLHRPATASSPPSTRRSTSASASRASRSPTRSSLVDSFSTDRTVEIARSFPSVKVVQREYFGSAAQKNWAMDQVTTPWLLIVDADERVPRDARPRDPRAPREGARGRGLLHPARERLPRPGHPPLRLVDRQGRPPDASADAARYPNRRVHADLDRRGADADAAIAHDPLHVPLARASTSRSSTGTRPGAPPTLPAGTPRGRRRAPAPAVLAILPDVRRSRPGFSTAATDSCCAAFRRGASFSSGPGSGSGTGSDETAGRSSFPHTMTRREIWEGKA